MPRSKSRRSGVSLPATLKRSPTKAQRTYVKAKKSAERSYGPGERAARTAISAVKHSFEKVGDHWEPKNGKGPSDRQARKSTASGSGRSRTRTAGGVDIEGHTRQELYERARALDIPRISRMTKQQLGEAIARRQ